MDLDGLIRIWTLPVIRNGLVGIVEIELGESDFHNGHSPSEESMHIVSHLDPDQV